ncbi:homoserine dehydrogenase [Candidatus Liberibacter solanacearum]|uniref:Homoserine dehydrogenase n=1 Tax=Candidatus Liberibacter solanacearum TaxID=556287 RepID=A0A0F4VIH6_9HYPH|nr:homoserine dehydrogenase [Candidatus Liberibacter solanacearum]KJZ80609.1 homoserine dehydrogenase [Candidatus Liberibacter solanacearum]KJZ81298.1 Homoserine dehydrogenase [Candidatus Liberibacter solanacearum]KQC48708.1 homoserine dehydrogenase [Candidatus Liberibacter solanacearum]
MENVLRIGVAGLGTVGSSLIKIIQEREERLKGTDHLSFVVSAISARDRNIDRGIDLVDAEWFDDPIVMADKADIDVFVEVIGGKGYPAYDSVRVALIRGCHVVTANKALIANHGVDLALLAQKNKTTLSFEAAVAGGIPVIKVLKDYVEYDKINRIYGIINGTCNYMLSHMNKMELSFEECLDEAKRCGYAEDNAEFDINGIDSTHKLAILSSIAFGINTSVEGIYCEGISSITLEDVRVAADFGYDIKLLAIAQRKDEKIVRYVYPALLKSDSTMALVDGITNAVVIETEVLGKLVMIGPGAGGNPTASAVLDNICNIAKIDTKKSVSLALDNVSSTLIGQCNNAYEQEKEYFIRLKIRNDEGVLDKIIAQMADFHIFFRLLTCPHQDENSQECSVFMITHEVSGISIHNAIQCINDKSDVIQYSRVICIENL